jgi:hypothetical protein
MFCQTTFHQMLFCQTSVHLTTFCPKTFHQTTILPNVVLSNFWSNFVSTWFRPKSGFHLYNPGPDSPPQALGSSQMPDQ